MSSDVSGTRTPAPDPPTALEVARAVRSRIDRPPLGGSVWGEPRTALLRTLRGTRAFELFGESGITAAASRTVHACCTFGYARLLAVKLDEPVPTVSPATVALLGPPCGTCQREIHDAVVARNVAAGRPESGAPRPTATTKALTAGAALRRRLDGPWSPDGWARPPDRVPTEVEDRQFLAAMARVQRRRSR